MYAKDAMDEFAERTLTEDVEDDALEREKRAAADYEEELAELEKLSAKSTSGPGMFESYKRAKKEHPTIDTWLTASVYHEYPIDAEEIIAESICNTSELPWEDPVVFNKIGLVINGRDPISGIGQSLDVQEIVRTVKCLKVAYPDEHFNDAVASYIAAVCIDEGFAIAPKIISFVQPKIPVMNLSNVQQEVLAARLRGIE